MSTLETRIKNLEGKTEAKNVTLGQEYLKSDNSAKEKLIEIIEGKIERGELTIADIQNRPPMTGEELREIYCLVKSCYEAKIASSTPGNLLSCSLTAADQN